jgi:hypothetical protein
VIARELWDGEGPSELLRVERAGELVLEHASDGEGSVDNVYAPEASQFLVAQRSACGCHCSSWTTIERLPN